MHRAFSLIELLIAMALGMVIIYTAVAGFRLASSSITVANRMSLENRIIRAGMAHALDQVDFWTDVDAPGGDPVDTAFNGQALRTWSTDHPYSRTSIKARNDFGHWWMFSWHPGDEKREFEPSRTKGSPFTPFSSAAGASALWPRGGSDPLHQRGWSATYAWPAHDPRTWWYGDYGTVLEESWADMSSPVGPSVRYNWQETGRYGLFANRKERPKLGNDTNTFYDFDNGSFGGDSGLFGEVDASHSWRDNQLWSLRHSLGIYGMADYVPANAISSVCGGFDYVHATDSITDVDERTLPQFGGHSTYHFTSQVKTMQDTVICFFPFSPYMFISPSSEISPVWYNYNSSKDTKNAIIGMQRAQTSYQNARFANYVRLYGTSSIVKPLLPLKPDTWPDCSIRTYRHMKVGHFINSCEVTWTSPLTGERSSISFNGFGTTLRGARQQRALNPSPGSGGWAAWYNLGDSRNELTLDDYP